MHGHEGATAGAKRGCTLLACSELGLLFSLFFTSKHSTGQGIDKTVFADDGMKLYHMYSSSIRLLPAHVSVVSWANPREQCALR